MSNSSTVLEKMVSKAPIDIDSDYVDVKGAAEYMGVTIQTIYRWIWSRKIPYTQPRGRRGRIRISLSSLDYLLSHNIYVSASDIAKDLNVDLSTVCSWVLSGQIPNCILHKEERKIRIPLSEFTSFCKDLKLPICKFETEEIQEDTSMLNMEVSINALMDKGYLRSEESILLTAKQVEKRTGIYFLIRDKKIVYVSRTKDFLQSILKHIFENEKAFDSYSIIEVDESDLIAVEHFYILKFDPEYNRIEPIL